MSEIREIPTEAIDSVTDQENLEKKKDKTAFDDFFEEIRLKNKITDSDVKNFKNSLDELSILLKDKENYESIIFSLTADRLAKDKRCKNISLDFLTKNINSLESNLMERGGKEKAFGQDLTPAMASARGMRFLMKHGDRAVRESVAKMLDQNDQILKESGDQSVASLLLLYYAFRNQYPSETKLDYNPAEAFMQILTTDKLSRREKKSFIRDLVEVAPGAQDDIYQTYLKEKGLSEEEAKDIVKSWHIWTPSSKSLNSHDKTVNLGRKRAEASIGNIENIEGLEADKKGNVKTLYKEYGITNFGRYPLYLLNKQCKEKDLDIPYGIILGGYSDNNGSFNEDRGVWQQLGLRLEDFGLNVRIVEARNKISVTRRLVELNKRYGKKNKISFRIIAAHGNTDVISFGEGVESSVTKEDLDRTEVGENMANFYEPNMVTVFSSCSTGKKGFMGMNNAVGVKHAIRGEKIIAPSKNSRTSDIRPIQSKNRPIDFQVKYAGSKTIAVAG